VTVPRPDQPPPPGGGAAVNRLTTVDARVVLERIAGTDLLERGSVTVISVEAIRNRVGTRWARRRDDVWRYVQRKCDEHLSFQDLRHQITETDLLIAMTTEEGVAAQAISLKILEEVLVFFLGSAVAMDLKVHAVTGIEGDALTTTPVDLARIAAARERTSAPAHRPGVDPREARRRNPVSFVTAAGAQMRVDFAIERVISSRHGVTAALRVQPTVRSVSSGSVVPSLAFCRLADQDIAFLDRSTFAYGALFMPADGRIGPPLILPASFRTIGGRRGREALIAMNTDHPQQVRQGIMLELVDIDVGTPTARLAEVVGLTSQLCRAVTARIWPRRDALAPVRGAKLHGLTVDVRDLRLKDRHLTAVLRSMALQARGKSRMLVAQGLPGPAWIKHADEMGFTHAATVGASLTASSPTAADEAAQRPAMRLRSLNTRRSVPR
jgi:hypothetical protein